MNKYLYLNKGTDATAKNNEIDIKYEYQYEYYEAWISI